MKASVAAVQVALIAPAAVFLLAVVARGVVPVESAVAPAAQAIVTWYADRIWTLWVLLLALPLCALAIGGVLLLGAREPAIVARRAVAGASVAAGVILAVVILHMLAN